MCGTAYVHVSYLFRCFANLLPHIPIFSHCFFVPLYQSFNYHHAAARRFNFISIIINFEWYCTEQPHRHRLWPPSNGVFLFVSNSVYHHLYHSVDKTMSQLIGNQEKRREKKREKKAEAIKRRMEKLGTVDMKLIIRACIYC